jgi:hypothetical protein
VCRLNWGGGRWKVAEEDCRLEGIRILLVKIEEVVGVAERLVTPVTRGQM